MTHTATKNSIILNPTRLCEHAIIGCTVLLSRDDPKLKEGVALTTLNAYDEQYVKYKDIDGMSKKQSFRYWKDVYLIVAYNDKNYKPLNPLKVGDKIFALFRHDDNTFTTVYYPAQIRELPINDEITIDFLDDHDPKYENIKMKLYTNIKTKDETIKVPTIIHRICAQNTPVHKTAIEKIKQNKHTKSNRA
eukprot:523131_1